MKGGEESRLKALEFDLPGSTRSILLTRDGRRLCPSRALLKDRVFWGREPASVRETRAKWDNWMGIGSYWRAGLGPPKRPDPKL